VPPGVATLLAGVKAIGNTAPSTTVMVQVRSTESDFEVAVTT